MSKRRVLAISAVILVVVAVAITLWVRVRDDDRFCPADAIVYEGETYGRDPDRDCRFVNDAGELLPDQ